MSIENLMKKAICLIDGFNIYHSLEDSKPNLSYPYKQYKWLNLKKLVEIFVKSQDQLNEIYYFTSYCTWDIAKVNRHKRYVYALKSEKIIPRIGRFKQVTKKCRADCKKKYETNEEKRTDVDIATHLISLAYQGAYDHAYLMTADTDQIPAIEEVKKKFPNKKIFLIVPIDSVAEDFRDSCDEIMKIREEHLKYSQFDLDIITTEGKTISCPNEWR